MVYNGNMRLGDLRHILGLGVDIAPSNASKCRKCNRHITKGNKRLVVLGLVKLFSELVTKKIFYHSECGSGMLKEEVTRLNDLITNLR